MNPIVQRIMQRLGFPAEQVAAAAKLASIYGLDRPDGGEGEQALIDAFREFATRAPV